MRGLLTGTLVALVGLAQASATPMARMITLINDSKYPIVSLVLYDPRDRTRGVDVLRIKPLGVNRATMVGLTTDGACRFLYSATYYNGYRVTLQPLDVCASTTIRLIQR